jgi:hypothetical protein
MRFGRKSRLAAVAFAVAAGASATAPAAAFSSPPLILDIQVLSPLQLLPGGAAVDVPTEVTCTSTTVSGVSVRVTQRVGRNVASGSAGTQIACTGSPERFIVTVPTSGAPFRPGRGVVTATIFGCAEFVCGNEEDTATVRIAP